MSIASRVKAYQEAAAATAAGVRPSLSPRTSLTFSSDDGLTAASSSAPASPKPSSVLEDLDSFVFTGTPSSSPSPTSFSSRPVPPPVPIKPSTLGRQQKPLISFNSPPKSDSSSPVMVPPLPPRRSPSNASLKTVANSGKPGITPPPLPRRSVSGQAPGAVQASNSLTIEHTFPPTQPAASTSDPTPNSRHAHASSTSSFQSLSLSDNGDEETITVSSAATSVSSSDDTNKRARSGTTTPGSRHSRKAAPPPIPLRPIARQYSGSSSSSGPSSMMSHGSGKTPTLFTTIAPIPQTVPYAVRRPVPPPRPSSSVGSASLKPPSFGLSPETAARSPSGSSVSGRRRVPVPPPNRARYEAVFDVNLKQQEPPQDLLAPSPVDVRPSPRSRPGWRGTSIDFRTMSNPPTPPPVDVENKLHGQVVKQIWASSKLEKKVLKEVWNECDSGNTGYLDREAFIQGMWRIDEELSKRASRRRTPIRR